MGYALFANRKIYLTNQIFLLQSTLDNIERQKYDLLTFSANIADGEVTIEEIASDAGNYATYATYLKGAQAYKETDEGVQNTAQGINGLATDQGYDEATMLMINEMIGQQVDEKYAQQVSKQLEAKEAKLDAQMKRIETQISAVQSELQSVEQAEAESISRATPKYKGVG